MPDETISQLDKRLVVCPLSERLGFGQNYRVTERPNKGHLESRPVKGTDAFADAFFKVLHAEKGQKVTVVDSRGEEIELSGLGFPDEQALRFSMKAGLMARQRFVQRVNAGEIKAPRKNWDKTYVPERTVTWQDSRSGDQFSFQIGGGKPIDTLKDEFPELYNTKPSRRSDAEEGQVLDMMDDDVLTAIENGDEDEAPARRMTEPVAEAEDDLEAMAEELDGEGAYSDEEEEVPTEIPDASYAASATAMEEVLEDETPAPSNVADDDMFPDSTQPGESAAHASHEGRLSGAAAARHQLKEETGSGRIQEFDDPRTIKQQKIGTGTSLHDVDQHAMTVRRPSQLTVVKTLAIKWMDEHGEEHTSYKVKHPVSEQILWIEEGSHQIDGSHIELKVQR